MFRSRRLTFFSILLFSLFSFAMYARAPVPPGGLDSSEDKEITVWAITDSKVYHCPGSRWYGKGEGKYVSECEATREGFRPAFDRGCGSDCKK